MCLAHSLDDLLDVGMGKWVTFSSVENVVVSPSPECDDNLPPPPQQQQAEKWGTAGTYVHIQWHPSTVSIGSVPKQMIAKYHDTHNKYMLPHTPCMHTHTHTHTHAAEGWKEWKASLPDSGNPRPRQLSSSEEEAAFCWWGWGKENEGKRSSHVLRHTFGA